MSEIPVAEQFYSVQGEGPYAGTPAVFLRLSGCNLTCGLTESDVEDFEPGDKPEGDATWICDTIDVWREASETPEVSELLDDWEARGWLDAFSKGAHLVFTGGEPLLPGNQKAIGEILSALSERLKTRPFVEVETNGSLEPTGTLMREVDQWNVSLKLSNSGMDFEDRITKSAIEYFKVTHSDVHEYDKYDSDATFKFVIARGHECINVKSLQKTFDIPDSMIMLMPAGQTQEQLRQTYAITAEICKEEGWRFSPRLQVDTWGEVTGV